MAAPISGIQGQLLEVTVVGCNKLKDTEWFSRQDPYVCLEYASSKFRTRTCTDGGKNPTFQEKFVFTLIEGLRELNVVVWNSNTLSYDDFIGSGKVQLQKVLSQGYDDSPWSIQTKTGRHAGEVRLILHFSNANPPKNHAASAPYSASPVPPAHTYAQPASSAHYPPPASSAHYPQPASSAHYPPPASSAHYPPPASAAPYPPPASGYPYPSTPYPPHSAAYPPQPYPPPAGYPPTPYQPPAGYPPPSQPSNHYPPGPYPGTYRPPY
ncbi:leucine-rich repeat extensin-like protein 3 isoform X2 [Daucus carota subsp. sativus]|uniref:leucine-rich repeat extensin-like protein 3 isoform X2 n=1 Tax=Daucus carota subsp. sativus TaxID=79200 RepID=UPI0007EFBEDA|nr:PREDICTED: leucine-rich repeat extensin-like protein 3 isoform X2 [Daucus carota subsp. sativus]